jgi:hypothetical protein
LNFAFASQSASGGVMTGDGTNFTMINNPAGNPFFRLKQW